MGNLIDKICKTENSENFIDKIMWSPLGDKVAEVTHEVNRQIDDFAVNHLYIGFLGSIGVSYTALGIFMHYLCQK